MNFSTPSNNTTFNFTLPCNGTNMSPPPPPPPTLSGGSAAFILIALMLGTLSQPGGSLVVSSRLGSWRVWRLSPLLSGLEGLAILLCLLQAPFVKRSQRERAFTILAKRTSSTHDESRPLVVYLDRPKLELIVPMMLQIFKLAFISGAPFTTAMAVMYWIDWAMVQYCQCWVWFKPVTEVEPRCKHRPWQLDKAGNVCKLDWGGVAGLDDSIKPLVSISKAIGNALLLVSNAGITGWWCLKILMYLVWIYDEAHWPWYKEAPIFILLAILAKLLFGGGFVMGSLMLFGRSSTSRKENLTFTLLRLWVVSITFIGLGIYYKFMYSDERTYKPAWLDWLG